MVRLFKKLRRKLDYLDDVKVDQIHQAYLVALEAHRDQKRRTGEPYITHPVAVACILAEMKMDHQTIMAALLHDVIEDTPMTKEMLEAQFGMVVAELVDGVSKLTQIEFVSRAEQQAENFRKMLLAMARDIRVIIVKLTDRLHNMRTLGSLRTQKKQRIARETLDIFAPVAKRLGMRDLSVELEELGFSSLYPKRHAILKEAIRRARGNRKKLLSLIETTLQEGLAESPIGSFVLSGREKHIYSIYRKMRNKHLSFNEIMDVYAFRVIVDDVDSCYRALGVIHQFYKPVPERFKDYIAIPKANGYQSLHTTLFGPYGLPIEVQIRTTEMDRLATSGIAAHWLYKSDDHQMSKPQLRAQKWVQSLLDLQQNSGDSLEFIESVKVDLFPDEIYVFTPKGKIMELPAGATAVDFSYAVHTDIGNSCVAVKVDRKLEPLSTPLINGQTIEVVTAPNARPNPAWLDFVVTSKARSGIRHFLKNQRRSESIILGKQLLQQSLSSFRIALRKLPKPIIAHYLKETKLDHFDDLLVEIGLGNRVAALVAQRLFDTLGEGIDAYDAEGTSTPMAIKGTEGMLVSYALCCCPIPGDPILGVLSSGKGIMVHMDRCHHMARLRRHPEKFMPLRWSEELSGDFLVSIRIHVVNQRGILAVLALAVSDADGNIEDMSIEDRDGQHYHVVFKVMVRDRAHLASVIRSLRQVAAVISISRGL
jgi:GTP diphosphokinase / guanosine-3',5'-bis(diphosphate) 3'-diphosphatase